MAIVYDSRTGEKMMNARELIDRSVSRTLEIKEELNRLK
jgi:hypothetical protein